MTAAELELTRSWATRRRGPGHWLASLRLMLRWELSSLRLVLPVTIAVQLLFGAGFVIGFGLILPDISTIAATYLVTGAAAMTLILVGLTIGPQFVSDHKQRGTYEFLWSLPTPRSAATAAWFVVTLIFGLPAFVATLLVGSWRYDLELSVSVAPLLPAVLLVVFTATMLGYALAHAVASPMVVMGLTQVMIFGVVGFTPINYPAERLPDWLQQVHTWLPLESMGQVVRAALTDGLVAGVARPYVVLVVWASVSVAIVAATLSRRG
jgi:ABC-2 type transport system permease protein